MFRRSSKMTAVLVAAAAIVSMVPASAAERLGSKEGTIDNARAFDGGYVYDGYRTDDDDQALYFNNGDKDKDLDEDEDYDNYALVKYGEKYATVKDGNDEYLVDLSTGKIDEDETVEDKIDNAKNKLKSKLTKEDRYINLKNSSNKDLDKTYNNGEQGKVTPGTNQFAKVLNDKYGEVWYQFSAAGDSEAKNRTTGDAAGYYQGFSNDSGKYIDVTQNANIYAYDTKAEKTVKIEEYGKAYGSNDLIARFKNTTAVAQDKDYLYLITEVEISSGKNEDKDTKNDNDIVATTQYYFQKVSKSQGEKKDGGYLPKTTTSYQLNTEIEEYEVTNDKGETVNLRTYNDGDSDTAADVIMSYYDYLNGKETKVDERVCENLEVVDGAIYATTVKEDNIKMYKLKFKKDKLDTTDKIPGQNKVKDDVDVYTVQKDSDFDHDTIEVTDKDKDGKNYSIDKDGNTWILDKGKILKVDGTDFKEVYTCDRSIDKLDVYDEKNLIAWCSDGDVYTTVAEGKKQTATDAGETTDTDNKDNTNNTTTEAQVGWVKNADSTWSYYKDGAKATGWLQDGAWYYLDAAGIMKTGWQQVGGVWYYLNGSGAMQTGWVNDNGTWYYCNASGAMLENQWFQDSDGRWYYLQASGAMAVNTVIGGYVIGANGAWVK